MLTGVRHGSWQGSVEDICSSDVKIIDYDFEGSSPPQRAVREETCAVLKPLCLPHLEYVTIWKRPLHRLPVHKDVPRLLKGMLVCETDGTELYRDDGTARPAEPATQVAALRKLMLALATKLDEPHVCSLIDTKLPEYMSADTGDILGGFVRDQRSSGAACSSSLGICARHPCRPCSPSALVCVRCSATFCSSLDCQRRASPCKCSRRSIKR